MFDKNKFAKILKEIYETFDTQREFSSKVGVSRGYLSEYMNMKKEKPPSPKILDNIATNSKGMTNYRELMQVCGYTDYLTDDFFDDNVSNTNNKIPIVIRIKYNKKTNSFITDPAQEYIYANFKLEKNTEYIAFDARDDSMLPLLGTEDTAIIEKCSSIKNNKIYLLINDDKLLIRKILILDNNEYELEPLNPYFPKEKATDLHIIGKVIRVEMKSAFL